MQGGKDLVVLTGLHSNVIAEAIVWTGFFCVVRCEVSFRKKPRIKEKKPT
ncbi:MAG: hypothetical protein WCT18_03240 [Patescibacteria group bacterium]